MREGLRRELTARKVIDQEVASKVAVTDKDITDFFQANKAQFNLPEDAYHIAQIVVTGVKDSNLTNRTGDDATSPQAATAKVADADGTAEDGNAVQRAGHGLLEDPSRRRAAAMSASCRRRPSSRSRRNCAMRW